MTIKVQPLTPFGVEVTGMNIGAATDDEVNRLKMLLADRGVVVLRNQSIGDTEFVNFLKRLGPLTFTVGEKPVPRQSWLNQVSNIGRSSPSRSVFHTDTSYIHQPPAYTALRSVLLPETGGETLFSNQYVAFKTLPSGVKATLSNAMVLHVASGVSLDANQESQSWHPLFRQHPISGKISLFLSTPERCQAIRGLELDRSQRAIRLLYKHSIRSCRLYRHHWQPKDLLIWDNRCTMHRADHSKVVGDRVLHRGLVSGEAPIQACIEFPVQIDLESKTEG
jgi:taurine dioxygenase